MKKKIICILLIILCLGVIGFCAWKLLFPEPEAFERQDREQEIADQYIESLLAREESEDNGEPEESKDPADEGINMELPPEAEGQYEDDSGYTVCYAYNPYNELIYWTEEPDGSYFYWVDNTDSTTTCWLKKADGRILKWTELTETDDEAFFFYGFEKKALSGRIAGRRKMTEEGEVEIYRRRRPPFLSRHTKEEMERFEYTDFEDLNYYQRNGVTYTPDFARGYLQCVLEVPSEKVQIKRGVYGGTWSDITYNLDIWMVTASRPDYVLGETHFCIYGHNHTIQDLSFNRLKYTVPGDIFTLTNEDGVYVYQVDAVFALSREETTRTLVDNFSLSSDKCYIITCGRDENRYKDLIVEGTLQKRYSLKEWEIIKEN